MKIRKARLDDVLQLAYILNQVIRIGGTTAYQEPRSPDYFNRFFDKGPKVFLHVAEADQLVGMQWVTPLDASQAHDASQARIGSIATFARPGITQRGIGSALFKVTRDASQTAGFQTLSAIIRADNTGGLAYYEKMGFRDHLLDRAVPLSDGTLVDRITKRLML